MPTTYETLNVATDTTTTKTILHEVLPLTGTLASGTYDSVAGTSFNIKNYTHGMFQSVYDYPYLSSSANHIYDLSIGIDESSTHSGSSAAHVQIGKKINMYNQLAQVLLGYTESANTVRLFENDLTLDKDGVMQNVFIIPFSRLITKDQIKKGTFTLQIGTGSWYSGGASHAAGDKGGSTFQDKSGGSRILKIQDLSASDNGGTTQTVGGEYGVLYVSDTTVNYPSDKGVGAIFYQAGVAIITASVFDGVLHNEFLVNGGPTGLFSQSADMAFSGSSISASCDAFRHRLYNMTFNNSTEINSTIYFCRLPVNKYNYSSNPSYTSGSKIVVKNKADDLPMAFVTTVGLYNTRNELLAVAKLSEPLKKTPQNELTLRVRLDY